MVSSIIRTRNHKRAFYQIDPPLTLHEKNPRTMTNDNANIGAHIKQRAALDPDRLKIVIAAMNNIGSRILALEQRKATALAAPQPAPTHDAPCSCKEGTLFTQPDGRAVLVGEDGREVFINPTHRGARGEPDTLAFTPTKDSFRQRLLNSMTRDTTMPTRNPALAPNGHLTFNEHSIKPAATRDTVYGEPRLPSRFDSKEQYRLAHNLPAGSAGPAHPGELQRPNTHLTGRAPFGEQTTAQSINAMNETFHAGRGASGQSHDNAVAPGGEGGKSGVNERGGMLEAYPSDLSEGFANALNQIPNGHPQQALNTYHEHYYKAKPGPARDAIDAVWTRFNRSYDGRTSFKPMQEDASPWSGVYEANKGTIGSNPDRIMPGQQLNVGGGQTHTVQSGETLSGISAQYGNPASVESGGGTGSGGISAPGGSAKGTLSAESQSKPVGGGASAENFLTSQGVHTGGEAVSEYTGGNSRAH
jgi:LysM repeat protein